MRIKEIDGLRAAAVLAVMVHHYLPGRVPGGYIGVDLFFVISGFVITSALKREIEVDGRVALRNFYIRRFFRILPPLAVMVGTILLIDGRRYAVDAAAALLSVMNWYRAFTSESGGVFGHAWSLSIEEQFYFLWPLALTALSRRRWTVTALITAIAFITVWRAILFFDATPDRIYNGLDTHADGLLIGCLIALIAPKLSIKWWLVPAGVLAAILFTTTWDAPWMLFAGLSLVAICSGALILAALRPTPLLSRLLTIAPVQWIGLRSYSIYLWHYPIHLLLAETGITPVPHVALASGLTFLAAGLSFRFIEKPCARLGHKFGRSVVISPANPHGSQSDQDVSRHIGLEVGAERGSETGKTSTL